MMTAVLIPDRYEVHSNITYVVSGNYSVKLDLHRPVQRVSKLPTLLYFHGGGWMGDFTKDRLNIVKCLPFLELGWAVVNADYRPSSVATAPAAVEDGLQALRWVFRNAARYDLDLDRLVLMGHSAGGHLALTTGMIPLQPTGLGAPAELEDMYGPTPHKTNSPTPCAQPAAIINWFGITDVADLIAGPNDQGYAIKWIGNAANRVELARSVSPLTYVRADVPAVISIHGVDDCSVPHHHAIRLHESLQQVGVENKLVSIPGAGHGGFDLASTTEAYEQIFAFLASLGIEH
jgi:acetyl esterase/lipase